MAIVKQYKYDYLKIQALLCEKEEEKCDILQNARGYVMLMDIIGKRQSVRGYSDKPVDKEIIERCLEAARLAPSACNSQPWRFVVVVDPLLKEKVASKLFDMVMIGNKFALSAPVVIAVVAEKPNITSMIGGFLKSKPYWLMDIGIAAEHFCLSAAEEGLGTCMLGWFNEKAVQKLLDIPRRKRIPLVITLGYPLKDDIREKTRKPIDKIRSYNKY